MDIFSFKLINRQTFATELLLRNKPYLFQMFSMLLELFTVDFTFNLKYIHTKNGQYKAHFLSQFRYQRKSRRRFEKQNNNKMSIVGGDGQWRHRNHPISKCKLDSFYSKTVLLSRLDNFSLISSITQIRRGSPKHELIRM